MLLNQPWKRWSAEDDRIARELLDTDASAAEFKEKLGRSKAAAIAHFNERKKYSARRAAPSLPRVQGRRLSSEDGYEGSAGQVIHRPSTEMVLEARKRDNIPRSLTAWLCGDPAPGHSALDKTKCDEL